MKRVEKIKVCKMSENTKITSIDISNHSTILTEFMKYCERIDAVWAKEFKEWIPDYLEDFYNINQSIMQKVFNAENRIKPDIIKPVCEHNGLIIRKKIVKCPHCQKTWKVV